MRAVFGFLLFSFMYLFSSSAHADGNKLLNDCNIVVRTMDAGEPPSSGEGVSAGMCLGLMQGITNLNLIYQMKFNNETLFCLPPLGINNGQAARIVVNYLRSKPEELHKNRSFLAIDAFADAFPCRQ